MNWPVLTRAEGAESDNHNRDDNETKPTSVHDVAIVECVEGNLPLLGEEQLFNLVHVALSQHENGKDRGLFHCPVWLAGKDLQSNESLHPETQLTMTVN